VPVPKINGSSTDDEGSRGNDEGRYDWCFHLAMYLPPIVILLILINCISWNICKRND
jgi:hypothetical protein